MARRYGNKVKIERKWKKISNMNVQELNTFKEFLEDDNQFLSKVYSDVITRLSLKV